MRKVSSTALAAALLSGIAGWTFSPSGAAAQQFAPSGSMPMGQAGQQQTGQAPPYNYYGSTFGQVPERAQLPLQPVQRGWGYPPFMAQSERQPYHYYGSTFGQEPDRAQLPSDPVQRGWGYPPFMAQAGRAGPGASMDMTGRGGHMAQVQPQWVGPQGPMQPPAWAGMGPPEARAGVGYLGQSREDMRRPDTQAGIMGVDPRWVGPQGPMQPPAWAGFGQPMARADVPYRAPRPDLMQEQRGQQEAPRFVSVASAADLVGRTVSDTQGEPVGNLEYVVLNIETGDLEYALIRAEPRGDFVPVPWTAVEVPATPDEPLKLAVRLDQMRQAMRLSPENLVRLTQPRTVAQIAAYYAVPLGGRGGQGGQTATGSGAAAAQPDTQQARGEEGQPRLLVGPRLITMIAPPRYTLPGQLRHADVVTPTGTPVGEIDQVMLDIDRGEVAYVLLAGGGYLGMDRHWMPVPFEALQWVPQEGVYVLPISDQNIAMLPRIEQGTLPTRVGGAELMALHRQFGLSPYWEEAGLTQYSMDEPNATRLAQRVVGSRVRGSGGQTLGTVADVVFDPDGRQPHQLVVSLEGEGGDRKQVSVPFRQAEWRNGVVVLPATTQGDLSSREAFAYSDDMISLRRMGSTGTTGTEDRPTGGSGDLGQPGEAARPSGQGGPSGDGASPEGGSQ